MKQYQKQEDDTMVKKFKFMKDYEENKEGDVIEMDIKIYHKFIHPLLMRGVLKVIGFDKVIKEKVKEVVNKIPDEIKDIRSSLRLIKMRKLRGLGADYNAKDTSKDELVDEIIEKVPLDEIKKFLEVN